MDKKAIIDVTIPDDKLALYASLKEKYNPEGSQIRNYQHHLVDTLVEFNKFCQEHKIQYSLAYGTMLGAIRHKGFIPWDDDADILMTRDNYEKLLSLRYGEWNSLNNKISLTNEPKPTIWMAPYADIDVFVLDNCPRNKFYKWIKQILIQVLYCILKCRGMLDNKQIRLTKAWVVFLPIAVLLSKKQWLSIFKVVSLWGNQTSAYLQAYNNILSYIKYVFRAEDVKGVTNVTFEGVDLPVFCGFDNILRTIYGDYMSLPKNIRSHGIVDKII